MNAKKDHAIQSGRKIEKILLKNGHVLDLATAQQRRLDVLIADGIIKDIAKIEIDTFDGEILDLTDAVIVPGLIDMHVHFREPGYEEKETLMTGATAAMAGGFTGVCPMPNTRPATDSKEIISYIKDKFKAHLVDVYPIAAVTKGRQGNELTHMTELVEAGAVAFSDDGSPVVNSRLMRQALKHSKQLGVPIIEHCEDPYLFEGGVMHESSVSAELNLSGIPSIAEEIMVARNIMLADYMGGRLHVAHGSTAGSIELIRKAKQKGVHITCEVTPHHFSLTHEAVKTLDTNTKMNPPLRTSVDLEAIWNGLKDGTIDVIASDHAPHTIEEKKQAYSKAPFGIIGLETMLGLAITKLVRPGILTLTEALKKMTWAPAKILGIERPTIRVNSRANLTFFKPNFSWQVDDTTFKSKSKNSPFYGWKLWGKIIGVLNNNQLWTGE